MNIFKFLEPSEIVPGGVQALRGHKHQEAGVRVFGSHVYKTRVFERPHAGSVVLRGTI